MLCVGCGRLAGVSEIMLRQVGARAGTSSGRVFLVYPHVFLVCPPVWLKDDLGILPFDHFPFFSHTVVFR